MSSHPYHRAPKGEGERLRDEILVATEDLLIETGSAEAVSIRGVADRVGVTPPSIYRHFPDKTSLLLEVCRLEFGRLYEAIEHEADSDDPVALVSAQARAYVRVAVEHPEHYRIMLLTRDPLARKTFLEGVFADWSLFNLVLHAVETLIDKGHIRPELAATGTLEVAMLLWAGVHGLASLLITHPDLPWPELDVVIDHHIELILHGLLVPDGTP